MKTISKGPLTFAVDVDMLGSDTIRIRQGVPGDDTDEILLDRRQADELRKLLFQATVFGSIGDDNEDASN